ncbi:hypothetical protein HZS61_017006 [Fusarium oxysporum f. sp. conglutinans]|uniref:Protein kinase domain-containing protein n=2 Tax=Fusarium oxysporum f. sp. conglutinans TaxID=100902 RepID=A0A8H6GJ27_FUSOX|nr:hypothetical protein HZS61_017006 [Fusarium oxysporum f. sp. conglutinans]
MADLSIGIAGLVGTIEVCIRFGKFLVQTYNDYRHIDDIANELSVRIQICWSRLSSQLEVMRELESGMTDDQRELQLRILNILQSKLKAAILVISKPDKHTNSRRVKALHFLNLRESFQSTVADLEAWQQRFEPSWFQIIKTSPADVDRVLMNASQEKSRDSEEPARIGFKFRQSFGVTDSFMLAEKVLQSLERRTILYCKAQVGIRRSENRQFIVDTVSREIVSTRDARELASRLRDSNPFTFGILKCKGLVQPSTDLTFTFIFGVPEGYSTIRSGRELLLSGSIPNSLTKRLKIARQLVTAVYYVHLYDFVHKNITPETILTLERPGGDSDELVICLIGFQLFSQKVKFIMQHDIYSLGVCLLEIGLWHSLVDYQDGEVTLRDIHGPLKNLGPEAIKDRLILMGRTQLRATMGDIYSRVVETCLTCLDEDNKDFGDPKEFEVQDGLEVGSRYVKKVMDAMNCHTMTHNNMEEQFSDIVRDFKLVTKHNGNLIVHLYNDPDAHPSAPQRQEHWREEERIDGGSQGTVWLQTCVRGSRHFTKRAVKKFLVGNRDSRLSYERELVAIVKFSHDRYSRYFVKSLGWYTSSSLLHIAMEYFPAGNLYTYVEEQQGLPEDECWQITSQVLSGIALMHEEGFAHRDLKPQNILIYERPPAQWWIKLADFGLSKNVITDPNNTDYALGTPGYIAPELYDADQRRCSTRDPQKPDIWALGVTALFILTNTVPFSGQDQTTQFAANRFPFPCAPLRSRNNELDSSLAASLDQGSYA